MKKSELQQIIREELKNTLNEGSRKQTAVEFLIEDLTRLGHNFKLYSKEIQQAKQMEIEQIKDAFNSGMNNSEDWFTYGTTE
jgi:hypothetical protein